MIRALSLVLLFAACAAPPPPAVEPPAVTPPAPAPDGPTGLRQPPGVQFVMKGETIGTWDQDTGLIIEPNHTCDEVVEIALGTIQSLQAPVKE